MPFNGLMISANDVERVEVVGLRDETANPRRDSILFVYIGKLFHTRPLHGFVNHCGHFNFADAGVGGLDLLGGQFQDMRPNGLLDEARQIAFPSAALAGEKHAKGLIGVRRNGDVPAYCAHGKSFIEGAQLELQFQSRSKLNP